jgi:hypothetical protein
MADGEFDDALHESYFIRLLATRPERVPAGALRAALKKAKLPFGLVVEAGTDAEWEHLTLEHRQGVMIATIDRIPVAGEGAGAEMLAEFGRSIEQSKPTSAAKWLKSYLPKVKAIYSFEVLDGTEQDRGWDGLYVLQTLLHEQLGGIFQSDGEGFSNEEGSHILWQFDDDVAGPWKMAVLQGTRWQSFMMDLENKGQRRAFLEGKLPVGARPVR